MVYKSAKELSEFYQEFADLIDSGISIIKAMEALGDHFPVAHQRSIKATLSNIDQGSDLAGALGRVRAVPMYDLPVIKAGEDSGQLVRVLRDLSVWHQRRHETLSMIQRGLYRPGFLLVVALFIPNLSKVVTGKMTVEVYLGQAFGVIGVIFLIGWYVVSTYKKSQYQVAYARDLNALFKRLPFGARIVRLISLQSFCTNLALLLEAGVPIIKAISTISKQSPDRDMLVATATIAKALKSGKDMPAALNAQNYITDKVKRNMILGTQSGKLPEMLKRNADQLRVELEKKLNFVGKLVPGVVYVCVVLYVFFILVEFYSERFKMLDSI